MSNHENTEGLTIMELVLEVREDVKEIKELIPHFVTFRQLLGAAATLAMIIIAVINVAT